jgi:sugar/nucleoside kinase (ribokinase family)
MSASPEVAVIGPLNVDLILAGDAPHEIEALRNWVGLSDITLHPAGAAGCPAQVFQKLGLRTGIVSVIADDPLGDLLRRGLAERGIDIARVHTAPGELTALAVYMLLFGSNKRPLAGRRSTHQPWPDPLDAEDLQYLASARLVHIAGYLHYPSMWTDDIPTMLQQARARGQMVSLDPQFPLEAVEGRWLRGVEGLLPHIDVLLLDEDEAKNITGVDDLDAAASMLQAWGPSTIAIKRGVNGCVVYHNDERIEQGAFAVPEDEVVDTIGAGDAFDAGFLAALLRQCSPAGAARIGSMVGAISLRGRGTANALNADDTIDRLIQRLCLY